MLEIIFITLLFFCSFTSFSQSRSLEEFLSDSSMQHASVSLYISDVNNNEVILEYDSRRDLIPASLEKLLTTSAAIEILKPDYTFSTRIGYSGSFNKKTGILKGDLIISGGGDPVLGSPNFPDHYHDFINQWVTSVKNSGIRKITGRVIADDSYYDFLPVPKKWMWEDIGNNYGAGAFGISVFDNTMEIHLDKNSHNSEFNIDRIIPEGYIYEFRNNILSSDSINNELVFSSPYGNQILITGSLLKSKDSSILKAAITDPPLLLAKIFNKELKTEGVDIKGKPTTSRLEQITHIDNFIQISETISPTLAEITEKLNHESINLYAEHLLKELGKKYKNNGSTSAGIEVVNEFLLTLGIDTEGLFITDGSGLSPANSVSSEDIVKLLVFMRRSGKYYNEFYNSLPAAGTDGTLRNIFTDPLFLSNLRAKSGSMTRVRNYAGYFTTSSGRDVAFCIIVNGFSGNSSAIITNIENILKEVILSN
jgi:serine-type D-Ala-D-Ala carboxypeptidase/endopeptidase (penicillin-binding protein 4)